MAGSKMKLGERDADAVQGQASTDTHFEKYNHPNPLGRYLVNKFLDAFRAFLAQVPASARILEVGAGDGYLTRLIVDKFPTSSVVATDISEKELSAAAAKVGQSPHVELKIEDIHALTFADRSFDFLVCCEVLEHVEDPVKGAKELYRVLKPGGRAIVSVPNEPLWRITNMARGKNLRKLGNTPGHINHWSARAFARLISDTGFKIRDTVKPFPWTMVWLEK